MPKKLLCQGYFIEFEQTIAILSDQQKRGASKSPDQVSQSGYSSNFGVGVGGGGGGGIKGVEGAIISHVFKPLVTRFVEAIKELKMPDSVVSIKGSLCSINKIRVKPQI